MIFHISKMFSSHRIVSHNIVVMGKSDSLSSMNLAVSLAKMSTFFSRQVKR